MKSRWGGKKPCRIRRKSISKPALLTAGNVGERGARREYSAELLCHKTQIPLHLLYLGFKGILILCLGLMLPLMDMRERKEMPIYFRNDAVSSEFLGTQNCQHLVKRAGFASAVMLNKKFSYK